MNAIPLLLADAVAARLDSAKSSFSSLALFTAAEIAALAIRRSYPDWDDDFKNLNTLAVDVVFVSSGSSGGDLVELDSEASLNTDTAIDIAVRYRFAATDRDNTGRLKNASVDRLVTLIEEIHEQLAGERMQALPIDGLSANWLDTSVRTYCDYKRLREGLFLGVVRVRYNASKVSEAE